MWSIMVLPSNVLSGLNLVLQSIGRSGTSYHVKLKFHLDNVFVNFLFASEQKCVLVLVYS